MTKRPLNNIAASVHQRLLNKARETGHPFNELLQYFAMERYLYRLCKSLHSGKFILKGALLLNTWHKTFSRPTKDIDFLGRCNNSIDSIISLTREICIQEVEPDGVVFDPHSVEAEHITEEANYEGLRVRFQANLGTARIAMQLDIGFGDEIVPETKPAVYPIILDFPAPKLRGYSKESTIAEKFEAMVKLGTLNSRMKDFFDIWLLSRQFNFEGKMLSTAIMKTFNNRGTEIPSQPIALVSSFAEIPGKKAQWWGFIRNNRLKNVPEDIKEVITSIAGFLGPIVNVLAKGRSFGKNWKALGPWSDSPISDS